MPMNLIQERSAQLALAVVTATSMAACAPSSSSPTPSYQTGEAEFTRAEPGLGAERAAPPSLTLAHRASNEVNVADDLDESGLSLSFHMPDLEFPPGEAVVWHDGTALWAETSLGVALVAEIDEVSRLWVAPGAGNVAYLSDWDRGWKLWVADLAASSPEPRVILDQSVLSGVAHVTPHAAADAHVVPWHLAWSPDGTTMVFTLAERWDAVFGFAERDDLWLLDAGGGEPREVLGPGRGGPAVFSPDGTHLAISRRLDRSDEGRLVNNLRSTLGVVDVATARAGAPDVVELASVSPFGSESDWTVYHGLLWSAQSDAISVAIGTLEYDGWAALDGPAELVRFGLDGSRATLAHSGNGSVPWRQFPNGHWSPDGSRMAWLEPRPTPVPMAENAYPAPPESSSAVSPAEQTLWVANVDGSGATAVTASANNRLLWSADGSVLAIAPSSHDQSGRLTPEDWIIVDRSSPIPRPDLVHSIDRWLGSGHFLSAERSMPESAVGDSAQARLVLLRLDGWWRELAPLAHIWATAPAAGALTR